MNRQKAETGRNVFNQPLVPCSFDPLTGYFRDGCCRTDETDTGTHVVCAIMTTEFLEFSRSMGNDLMRAQPEVGFPGLFAGDQWCLCALRWEQAYRVGKAPRVVLESTNIRVLDVVDLAALKQHAWVPDPA
jgi:uncharacterized protein